MQIKRCTVCLIDKLATKEFFRQNLTHKFGLYSVCKQCERPRIEKWTNSIKYKNYRRMFDNLPDKKLKARYRTYFSHRLLSIALNKNRKDISFIENKLGYKLDIIVKKFEKMFRDGMNWKNHGKLWQIDHITPVCSFKNYPFDDYSVKKCWSIDNLQPLLIQENIKKGKSLNWQSIQ